jgi:hypothetical protein
MSKSRRALSVQGENEILCYGSTLSFSELHHSLGMSRECRMAAIPTREDSPAHRYCGRVGDSARVLVMTALKAETGLDLRSSGATLLSEDGAIDVQVPAVTASQVQAGAGMIFWIRPKKSEWTAWRAVGPGVRYRDYELGLAHFPTLAQRTAGITGPIVRASEIRLRFTLRLGQEQCSDTRSGRATGAQVAHVIVFRDTRPATGAIRAWTRLHPHGVSLHHTRLPDSASTDLTDDTNLANEDGTRDTVPAVIRAARVKAERDEELEEASGGIHDGALPTLALKRRRGDTSMPGGRPVLIGGGAHLTQPDVRAPAGSPPRQSEDLGGTVPFF